MREVVRARIVLLAGEGVENRDIAEQLGAGPDTVSKWRRHLAAQRLTNLVDCPGRGRKPHYGRELIERIVDDTVHRAPEQATHWSTRSKAKHAGVCHTTVQRIWHAHELKPFPVRTFKLSNDKHFLEKLRGVIGLYLTRHEVPRRDAFGSRSCRRPPPHPLSIPDIQALLSAALAIRPAGTITPLTWHHMLGLIATTGIRISEALALVPGDITVDGLVIRETKFRKSRMIALHPTTRDALERYLVARRRERTPHGRLFVLATGRPPSRWAATKTFRKLAEQTGLRDPAAPRGPTPHSLRHAFAVRSLENLARDADPSRHMLALATYLGHSEIAHTYWYLEAAPVLLRGIAEATERSHREGTSDD